MANAVVPRWHGDNYQSRFFWMHAALLRDPNRPDVVEVTFEANGPKAFDDVVIRYDPGRVSSGPHRITVDHHQIKWHTDNSGLFGYRDLIDPAFVGAASVSLLQRLQQAKRGLAPGTAAAFTLVTTDEMHAGDLLRELVSKNDNALLLHRLFDETTDKSRMGEVRRCWREHLGLSSDNELRDVLEGFHIKANHLTLEDLRGRVSERFRLVGLHGCEDSMEFRYDDAARQLVVRRINRLDRKSFERLCQEEKWLQSEPIPPMTNVAIRSFVLGLTPSDLLDAAEENTLALDDWFDGRHLKPDRTWASLRADVVSFVQGVLRRDRDIRLFLDAHASIAFLAGSEMGFKSGANVEVRQKGRGPTKVWSASDGRGGPEASIDLETSGDGDDLAVSVALSRDTHADVRAYLAANLNGVGRMIAVTPAGGPGQEAIAGGEHAAKIADQIATAVAKARRPGKTTHVFVSGPNAFSFLLGQHAASMGNCIPYEFDFGGRVDASYRPSFTV